MPGRPRSLTRRAIGCRVYEAGVAWNGECVRLAIVPAVSSTSILLAGSTLLAFALAAIATPLVGMLARRLGMLDMPGGRRRHPRPIPRPGGLAIALAFGSAIFVFWLIDRLAGHPFLIPEEVRSSRFTLTAIAALLGMAVGLIDDFLELRARWQFPRTVLVAAVIVLAASGSTS